MLDSVFVGSEWIIDRKNQLSLIRILHLNQRNQRNQILFQYLRDKKKKKKKAGSEKGGGGENSPISPPLDPRLLR